MFTPFFNAEERKGLRGGTLREIDYNWIGSSKREDRLSYPLNYYISKLAKSFMQEVSSYNHELINRISPIVENLFKANSLYPVKLNKQEMIEMLVKLFRQFTPEEMRAIKDNDLTRRIDKILVVEAISGTLNDLTPQQIKMFDEAVKRK
jgi:hypothetical protein